MIDHEAATATILTNPEWIEDCKMWRGQVLTGKYAHWCYAWDMLPIDETCDEWPCECAMDLMNEAPNDRP